MTYDDNALGPIGYADRNLLVAITQYFHEPVVLEFGSANGHSLQAWLDGGAKAVHCVDIHIRDGVREIESHNTDRVCCYQMGQHEFTPTWQRPDIVFFDASHDHKLNLRTLERIKPCLHEDTILVIHDTGLWAHCAMTDEHKRFNQGHDTPAGFMHQPGEIRFVQALKEAGWNCITFSSKTALRHGITLCQR